MCTPARQLIAPDEARDAMGSDDTSVLASPVAGVPPLTTLPVDVRNDYFSTPSE